jgi:DNA end-binding protein Ku
MYYLLPSGASASEPYSLLEAAMEKKGRWGIGQVVFSGREQLALIRPLDGVLTMAMLNYDAEIRKPAEIKSEFTRVHATPRKLKLAEELVGKWHEGKFDFSEYKDNYRKKIKQAIEAKEKGVEIEAPEEEEHEVINLMEALQRSVAHAGTNGSLHSPHPARTGKAKAGKKKQRPAHRRRA